jgi:hypothetical protein
VGRRSGVIEVRIRHEGDSKSARLCDWPATKIDRLIPTLRSWGVLGVDGEHHQEDLVGQFVLSEGEAYFEVTICEPDE